MFGLAPLKTMAFLCFQIYQATRMITELRPLRISLGRPLIALLPPPGETGCRDMWCHRRQVKLLKEQWSRPAVQIHRR